ncbi:MAG: ATP-dependent DNA helicase RecG [Chloroflexi bacterium]|nr:ATP-dependent DNA helicase RecG [Chloroflexota bacterium]
MPSALETLVKILKLEQSTGYKNTAVIGGLESYADNWAAGAHQQAKRPEHHQLVDEMAYHLRQYSALENPEARYESIKYMMGRIMGRIPAPPDLPPSTYIDEPYEAAGMFQADDAEEPEPAPPVEEPAAVEPAETGPYDTGEETEPEAEPGPAAAAGMNVGPSLKPASTPPMLQAQIETDEDEGEGGDDYDINDYFEFSPVAPQPSEIEHVEETLPTVLPTTPVPRKARREATWTPEEAEQRLADLQAPITVLHKVGAKMGEKLEQLGIRTIQDMIFSFPRRYDDYTRMRTLNRLRPGETVTVIAEVASIVKQQGRGGRPYLLLTVTDNTAEMQVTFFGQLWLQRQFKRGSQIVLSGEVALFRGKPIMTNPEWEMLERDTLHTRRIVPVYPLTKGLSARTMRRLMHQVVDEWSTRIPDYMPQSVLERASLADLGWSIRQVHFPESHDYLAHARTRLSFDELFLFQMGVMMNRRDWQAVPGQPLHVSDEWLDSFLSTLPYSLTGAQQRVLSDIRADLSRDVPMNRLLQGDVGSGKTVVAAAALAVAIQNGKQAALMAPTSILAEQHARSVGDLLRRSPGGEQIQVRLLTGNTSESEREEIYRGLAEGSVHVVIGTHALIQERVEFHDLGLAIVDEQHRFGVEQRGTLRGKGTNPHLLVMTATPIPRTLALTLYADLDLSIIDEMPPGRTPIDTRVLLPIERERAYSFIRSQLNQGRQAFIIYPLVEASEQNEDIGSAVEAYEQLKADQFAHYRVGLLHGRMKPAEKEAVMSAFAAHELDVLVATAVVEVGIDVPNASVMLIEDADRFGLAQLHQFRGRVGRGEYKSFCLLLAENPTPDAEQRLKAMEETTDGFRLAEIDWEMRGPGDLLGVRQSGMSQFRLSELMNPRLVELAQREVRTVFAEDPNLERPEHGLLSKRVRAVLDWRADVS